ncbi:MAG: HDIG domain-containing metalloprotein [Chloroflexota bacterium]
MIERLGQILEDRLSLPREQIIQGIQWTIAGVAILTFVLVATFIIAFESIFSRFSSTADLAIGQVANRNIVAPANGGSYISEVQTENLREEARNSVQPIYSTPDLEVARTWGQRAEQTLEFIDDVRAAGRYDTIEQQLIDLAAMDYLLFSMPEHAERVLTIDEDTWRSIATEVDTVLDRVYRTEIRDEEDYVNTQLSLQISRIFDTETSTLIYDLTDDFVRPNTFENETATAEERERQAAEVQPVERTFVGGQIIVEENEPISALAYEALVEFNLIQPEDVRFTQILRALTATILMVAIFGWYLARFDTHLLIHQPQRMMILGVIFLIMLALTRALGINGNIYLFPAAAMSLLFVAIAGTHSAVIGTLGLALLMGLVANDSLEVMMLIAVGGIIGALSLRRAERLNQFFVAGAIVGIFNVAVVIIFNSALSSEAVNTNLLILMLTAFIGGLLLVPATAMAAMFVVTALFNLPTALKLIELQQPNKPMLQRLLREAPGTYQHSLQVGNLAEQAANAIGADAHLTHVAALYHDIGKMHSPLYFTENQKDIGNPHDTLGDPYRSADIIISHITEGDEMAKQAGLPQRIRDFIREHHGTTQVFVFYQQALKAADGDKSKVDISDFTYPGPKPRSRETAILMLADSCEAAVRSINPQSKAEISELVGKIIESKRSEGQLDESGLTLNDLRTIREIFVDILQGMFHPRINYREAIGDKPKPATPPAPQPTPAEHVPPVSENNANGSKAPQSTSDPDDKRETREHRVIQEKSTPSPATPRSTAIQQEMDIADEEPMTEVPRLPSLDERRATSTLSMSAVNLLDDDDAENEDEDTKDT